MPRWKHVFRPKPDKPKPIDYAVMIGGPLLFMAIAIWGLRTIAGVGAPESAIQRLRDGAVRVGMSPREVTQAVGLPKAEVVGEDGHLSYRYMNSAWDVQRATFLEEDAYVEFDQAGRVSSVSFESRTPEPPK